MGAARQGFNAFNPYGRQAIWHHLKRGPKWWRHIYWSDTFGQFVCAVVGHNRYDCSDPGRAGEEFACRRCHQYLPK